ncbi:MAG: hypothetical protein PHX21_12705 [bacterium]|nr:hypothetical protein [bacterium]
MTIAEKIKLGEGAFMGFNHGDDVSKLSKEDFAMCGITFYAYPLHSLFNLTRLKSYFIDTIINGKQSQAKTIKSRIFTPTLAYANGEEIKDVSQKREQSPTTPKSKKERVQCAIRRIHTRFRKHYHLFWGYSNNCNSFFNFFILSSKNVYAFFRRYIKFFKLCKKPICKYSKNSKYKLERGCNISIPIVLSPSENINTGDRNYFQKRDSSFSRSQAQKTKTKETENKIVFMTNNETFFTLRPNDYRILIVAVRSKYTPQIHYIVNADMAIEVYLLDEAGIDNFENDRNFNYYTGHGRLRYHEEKKFLPYSGEWYILIRNNNNVSVNISYQIFT